MVDRRVATILALATSVMFQKALSVTAPAAGQQQQADERDDDGQRLEGAAHGWLRVHRLPVSKEFGLLRRKSASARIEIAADLNSRRVEVTSLSIAGFRATSRCRVSTS